MSETSPKTEYQALVETVAKAIMPGLRRYENCVGDASTMRQEDARRYAAAAIAAMITHRVRRPAIYSFLRAQDGERSLRIALKQLVQGYAKAGLDDDRTVSALRDVLATEAVIRDGQKVNERSY